MKKRILTKESLEELFRDPIMHGIGLAWADVSDMSPCAIEGIRNWARQLGWYAYLDRSGSTLYFSMIATLSDDWTPFRNWTEEQVSDTLTKAVTDGNYLLALNVSHSDDGNVTDICHWLTQCGWKVEKVSGNFIDISREVKE